MKDCTIAHELVPIVTMTSNGMHQHQHQYHQSPMPEMLDNIPMPDMTQYENNETVMLSQLDIFQQQSQSMASPPLSNNAQQQQPPPPSATMNVQNILTGVYTLQEEPEETEENTTM